MVVGIGASERGLNSVKQVFAGMPPGHGVAFVLIHHLGPSQENIALKELRNQTTLSVVEAAEGMQVLADRIHVMPGNRFLNISGSILTLQEPAQCNGLWMPIDQFFCSLAEDQRRRGCAILLSGTGGDGVAGLSEIKANAGRTIVEDPGSEGFPAMTQRAIDMGVVDEVLPVKAMAEAIVGMAEQVISDTRDLPAESPEFDADLKDILDILRAKVGHDFRCYKPNTIVRRIRRRMTLAKMATFAAYAGFLREAPDEVGLLQKDLLIGVTDFFRQPQAWDILQKKVIADILEKAEPGGEIRVWVPGCSTGQEVYSLAMLLAEEVEKKGKEAVVQIFATDSDVASLGSARNGTYSVDEIGKNFSRERLKRFFERKDGRYQVIKKLREQIVFAPQNLTSDPPFSRLDLVSCRNLLMYFEQPVQEKIIALFHFALREGGYLFLGTAETVGDRVDLFEPVSKKWRIYRRIGVDRPLGLDIPVRPTDKPFSAAGKPPVPATHSRLSLASAAQQMLLDRFAPACVIIDRKLQVLYVHGDVENYLTFPPGELTTRVVDMAREGLRARLRGAISKSLEINKPVSLTARVRRGSTGLTTGRQNSVAVKASVSPLRHPTEVDGLLLIAFEDYHLPIAGAQPKGDGRSDIQQLEDELKVTREELQSTIEQLGNSNDQLKAYNEEVTAANEELQSANEEMETSKEELQSLNEELNTINARLQEKVEELESVNNDMVNLLSSTSIATVFLDKQLRVRRFTPASTTLLSLIPSDLGRPIGDILRRFRDEALLEHAAKVLADLTPITKEVQAEDGRWYIRSITPYRTQDDRIEGVVITFVDVCELKESEEALREAKDHLETRVKERTTELEQANRALQEEIAERRKAEQAFKAERQRFNDVLETLPAYVVLLTPDYRVSFANKFFRERFGEDHGRRCFEYLFNRTEPCEICETYKVLKTMEPYDWEWTGPDGRNYDIHDFPFVDTDGSSLILEMGIDITERKRAEEELRRHKERLEDLIRERTAELESRNEQLAGEIAERMRTEEALRRAKEEWERTFDSVPDLIAILDEKHRVVRANRAMAERLRCTPGECVGLPCHVAVHGTKVPPAFCPHTRTLADCLEHTAEVHEDRLGGHFLVSTTPICDEQGKMLGSVHVARDITQRKAAEEAIRDSEQDLNFAQAVAHTGSWRLDLRRNKLVWSDETHRIFEIPKGTPMTYQAFLETIHPDDRKYVDRKWTAATQGEPYDIEHRIVVGDTVKWVRERAELELDTDGSLLGGFGIVQDITERKRVEESLRETEARSRLLSWTASALLATDNPQRIVNELCGEIMANLDCQAFFNFLVDEQAGKLHLNAWAGIPEEEAGKIEWLDFGAAVCGCAARDKVPIVAEDIFHSDDPRTELVRPYGIQAYACHPLMVQGRLIGTLSFGTKTRSFFSEQDLALMKTVTDQVATAMERMRLVEELQKSRDQLELRVQERTAELVRRNKELQEFVFVASHDLREPLRKIQTFGDLVGRNSSEALANADRNCISRMQGAAARMQTLLDSLLRYSRVTNHKEPFQETDMIKSVEEALSNLEVVVGEKKARLEVGQLPTVEADGVQMVQLFQNLISNALRFQSPNNIPIVRIHAKTVENRFGGKNAYEISIEDNGIGFDEKYLDKIFKPFQRLHGRDEYEGVGIGLAICRKIVEHHRGTLTAMSTPGKGATFIVTLPRKQSIRITDQEPA